MSRTGAHQLLVIGGGPAALSAVRAYRAAGGQGRVGLVCDERRMPYQRPALSKQLLRGEISDTEVALESDSGLAQAAIELIPGRAVSLDPKAHTVQLSGGRALTYVRCLIATGAEPARLPVPGADDAAVRTLRSLEDMRELRSRLSGGGEVVVIGSGFIGCEIAASLRAIGHPVSLCSQEAAPNTDRLGPDAAARVQTWLIDAGVALALGAEVQAIRREGERLAVQTAAGETAGDVVVMATGVAPRAELAALAGLELEAGAIPANAQMATELPDVFAAGDVALAVNATAARRVQVEHWGDAIAQGDVAGRVAAGSTVQWADVPGFWSEIAGRTLKFAGWGEGFDEVRFKPSDDGAFAAWYRRADRIVGVLTHERDDAYRRGRELVAAGARWR
ncbi:MAG: FAD-dependent oxidoreductase [Actinomycetota bacterium]|nr:FAD-dependent oxidoreductase [Actinomycetota bacterium]